MSGLDELWAREELEKFIELTVMRNGSGDGYITMSDFTRAPDHEVVKQAQVVEKILDRVLPDWRSEISEGLANNRWARHREAAIRAREELARGEEIRLHLGDGAPHMSAAELHPWVWTGARALWSSGHYLQAVFSAAVQVNAETQNKVARRDVSERKLFQEAFSEEPPAPGRPRLRLSPDDGGETYRSRQRGARALAEGIYAGIRNPIVHDPEFDITQQEALEYLAALSVLARWVDNAEVVTA